MVGRERERQVIERSLASARSGASAVLALRGEPGIGKSELLDFAGSRAGGLAILRARGVEAESRLPFAGLSELLRPVLGALGEIPAPQARALEGALALRQAREVDRFAVAVATLSLLAASAERRPLLLLIDDAHLLDPASADALRFALRRLLAEPLAALLAVRSGERSLLDGSDIDVLELAGLEAAEAVELLHSSPPALVARLHAETAGNPLALLELREEAGSSPPGTPMQVSTRISRAFARRADALPQAARTLLLLAAASSSRDLSTIERAAAALRMDVSELAPAEQQGLVRIAEGTVEFRHPLARSAIYSEAPALERRAAHRALARALAGGDQDERAWQLALAAGGTDAQASAELESAAGRARLRGAHAVAASALERAATLAPVGEDRARLLLQAAHAAWQGNQPERARALIARVELHAAQVRLQLQADTLKARIALRCGPVGDGVLELARSAERVQGEDPELAISLLAEAVEGSFCAGGAQLMAELARRAVALLTTGSSARARFLAYMAAGMAGVFAGHQRGEGIEEVREAVALAEGDAQLRGDPELSPWLTVGPLWLREAAAGARLLEQAQAARDRASLALLPGLLNRVARHQAANDSWARARVGYDEAQRLARESGQRRELAAALAGVCWVEAREGRQQECRAHAGEALELCDSLGLRLYETWALRGLAELALAQGEMPAARELYGRTRARLHELAIADVDLDPAPELVACMLRLGESGAGALAEEFASAAQRKGQPWSLARARRAQALVAHEQSRAVELFQEALTLHEAAAENYETACTRLAYGARLRRARMRVAAREHLRLALESFERLGARPWAEAARSELAATGEHARRRDPSTLDELTSQELQIARLLVDGRTTREAAAALFLSPKTIEYHLRSVYRKLGVKSRPDLARALGRLG